MPKRIAALAGTALLLLTACGGPSDTEKATASLQAELVDNAKDTTNGTTPAQAKCVAEGMVKEIGISELQDYGVLDKDLEVNQGISRIKLTMGDAQSLADVTVGCINLEKRFEKSLTAAGKSTERQRRCVDDAVDKEAIAAVLAQGFSGEEATANQELQKRVLACSTRR